MKTTKLKNDNALRTIGEVAELLEIPTHIIRFWETKFPQIKPVKYNTRRYYSAKDVALLSEIKLRLYSKNSPKKSQKTQDNNELILIKEKLLKAKNRLNALLG